MSESILYLVATPIGNLGDLSPARGIFFRRSISSPQRIRV